MTILDLVDFTEIDVAGIDCVGSESTIAECSITTTRKSWPVDLAAVSCIGELYNNN